MPKRMRRMRCSRGVRSASASLTILCKALASAAACGSTASGALIGSAKVASPSSPTGASSEVPERDTPQVLKEYAHAFGANLAGWAFLTGTPDAIRDVTRRYGAFASKTANGDVDHTFLTSIVDPSGILRVQYVGVRFDPDELRRDLLSLLQEP